MEIIGYFLKLFQALFILFILGSILIGAPKLIEILITPTKSEYEEGGVSFKKLIEEHKKTKK